MIRRPPALTNPGLRMRITERERQQADVYVKDTPHFLRLDRVLARLSLKVARLEDRGAVELNEEGTGAKALVHYDGSSGVSARRIR